MNILSLKDKNSRAENEGREMVRENLCHSLFEEKIRVREDRTLEKKG